MASISIILSVIGRTAGVAGALGGIGKSLGGIASQAAGFAIGQGLANLPGLLIDSAKAAVEDEAATARLSKSLANLGGDVAANTRAVNDRIAAGQALAFSDDEIRDSFQFLAAATGSATEALSRQNIAMDLARGAGITLEAASKLVGKVTAENVQAFKRMGITIREGASEQEALAAIQAKFSGQADTYAQSSKGQMEAFSIAISELQEGLGSALLPLISKFGSLLSANLPTIQAAAELLTQGIAAGARLAGDAIGPVIAAIQQFGSVALPVLQTFAGIWRQVFEGDIASALQNWVGLLSWVGERLGEQVLAWGQQFVAWIAPMIGPLLEQLGILVGHIGAWIAQVGAPLLAEKVKQWIPALIDWLGEAIPAAITALGKFLTGLVNSIASSEGDISDQVDTSWVPALVDWITEKAIPALIENLPKIAAALLNFMLDLGVAIAKAMARIGAKFIAWMVDVVLPSIPPAMERILIALGEWITGTALPWLGQQASLLGQSIVNGIVSGINSLVETVKLSATNLAQSVLDAIVAVIVPGSPSKITTEYGKAVAEGLVFGIDDGIPAVSEAAAAASRAIVDRVANELRAQGIKPSAAMIDYGRSVGLGLATGIAQSTPPVDQAAANMANGVIGHVNDALGAINALAKATGGSGISTVPRSGTSGAPNAPVYDYYPRLPNLSANPPVSLAGSYDRAKAAEKNAGRTSMSFHAPVTLHIQGGVNDAMDELSRLYGGA